MGYRDCYFDNAATTKPDPKVIEDIIYSMEHDWYNPSAYGFFPQGRPR